MTRRPHRARATERDLAALADGSLAPARRDRVERAVAASPHLQAQLQDQRLALAAVRAAAEPAPAALRARVALAARPLRRPPRRIAAVAVAGTAAIAAAIVLTFGGGPAESPTVADAAALGDRPPIPAALEPARAGATLPRPRQGGLPFPDWQRPFGWKAFGLRQDRLGGRPATTVFYRRQNEVVAYTIVAGRPLPARPALRRTTFTWLRRGHTCVLSGRSTDGAVLLRLARWHSGGDIPF